MNTLSKLTLLCLIVLLFASCSRRGESGKEVVIPDPQTEVITNKIGNIQIDLSNMYLADNKNTFLIGEHSLTVKYPEYYNIDEKNYISYSSDEIHISLEAFNGTPNKLDMFIFLSDIETLQADEVEVTLNVSKKIDDKLYVWECNNTINSPIFKTLSFDTDTSELNLEIEISELTNKDATSKPAQMTTASIKGKVKLSQVGI